MAHSRTTNLSQDMSSHSGRKPSRTAPPRPPQPPRPRRAENEQERSSSSPPSPSSIHASPSNGSPSSIRALPLYEDVMPGPSTQRTRRGSDGDMRPAPRSHQMRRVNSTRRTGRRKFRPEITIVSSQPMHQHPAFADGAKGSCVPPEAPPSYDEAMRTPQPQNATFTVPTIPDHTSHHRRVYSDIGTDLLRSGDRVERAAEEETLPKTIFTSSVRYSPEAEQPTNTSSHERDSVVQLIPKTSLNHNRNHNNSDSLKLQSSSRSRSPAVHSVPSTCASSSTSTSQPSRHAVDIPVPTPRSRRKSNKAQISEEHASTNYTPSLEKQSSPSAQHRSLSPKTSSASPQHKLTVNQRTSSQELHPSPGSDKRSGASPLSKPPVPYKKLGLRTSIHNKPGLLASANISQTSTSQNYANFNVVNVNDNKSNSTSSLATNSDRMSTSLSSSSSSENSSSRPRSPPKQSQRKLPPPPRPSTVPKRKTPPKTKPQNSTLDIDESSGYASIIGKNSNAESENKQVANEVEGTKPDSPALDSKPAENGSTLKTDENVADLITLSNDADASLPEPTYACVNKKPRSPTKPSLKPKPRFDSVDVTAKSNGTIEEHCTDGLSTHTHDSPPPPIPDTRPPIEDYSGILPGLEIQTAIASESADATSQIEDVFGRKEAHKQTQDFPPKPMPRSGVQASQQTKSEHQVTEDELHHSSAGASSMLEPEPQYEEVHFKTKTNPVKPSVPPPKPVHTKPHALPTNNEQANKPKVCPPLPATRPVGKADESDGSVEKKPPSTENNAVARRESSTSKGFNLIKRKSLKIKEKSLRMFKPRNSLDGSEVTTLEEKPSPVKLDTTVLPKSPSTKTAAGNTADKALDKHEKPKRLPPPRPSIPTALMNKQRSASHLGTSQLEASPVLSHLSSPPTSPTTVSTSHSEADKTHLKPTRPAPHRPPSHKAPPPPQQSAASAADGKLVEIDIKEIASTPPKPKPRKAGTDSVYAEISFPSPNAIVKKTEVDATASTTKQAPSLAKAPSMTRPARPPPIKATPTRVAGSKVKPQPNGQQEEEKKEESLLEVFKHQSAEEEGKPKPKSVDEQMKNYITEELYYIATEDYQAENFTDLCFSAGERITVMKRLDDSLLFGRNEEGEEGPFPEKYVRLEGDNDNNSNSVKISLNANKNNNNNNSSNGVNHPICKAVSLYEYASGKSGDLKFAARVEIEITEFVGKDWLMGRVGNSAGLFPKNFVKLHDSDDSEKSDAPKEQKVHKKVHSVKALYEFKGLHDNELTLSAGDTVELLCRIDDEWLKGRCRGLIGIFPATYVDAKDINLPMENERQPFSPLAGSLSSSKGSYVKSSKDTIAKPIIIPRSMKNGLTGNKQRADAVCTAVALFPFEGQDSSELTFEKNDVITITKKVNTEWLEGKVKGHTGIFPSNYVKFDNAST